MFMKNVRKKFKRPKAHWETALIKQEKEVVRNYGLRRKKELWKSQEILRRFRERARRLNAVKDKESEKILLDKLKKLGILSKEGTLDEVLALTVDNVLSRRLQTIVFRKGYAKTPMQARQLIAHGHVTVNGRKAKFPSYIISMEEEPSIKVLKEVKNA
jgi:small subunit ribosomal protein S4